MINYPFFAYVDAGIYPYAAAFYHASRILNLVT